MKIKKIEFENFRNFKDHGEIKCSTDGKVTLIYGKNGDGKTTLHQLFQWIFYGQVRFNKTATDRLYNLQYESDCSFGDVFDVMGRIDFTHDNREYSLTRTYTYKKRLEDSEKIAEDLSLNMMDNDNNWRRVERPKETIEKLLPSGLSDYFFFDGESMIADLRVKGKDSAGKLKKALYSMFDLDVIESALSHIGRTDLRTTALGKLFLSKGTITSGSQISSVKTNIQNAQFKLEKLSEKSELAQQEEKRLQGEMQKFSEQIGGTKSKSEYELQRRALKRQRDLFFNNANRAQSDFGDEVLRMFPSLLISQAVKNTKEKIHLKIEDNHLPVGVNKRLITYLLSGETDRCICGHALCSEEKQHIQNYLNVLPPRSYTSLYNEFSKTALSWGKGYDIQKIESHIMYVLNNQEEAEGCDHRIKDLDDEEKKNPDVEDLIVARQQAESRIAELNQEIIALDIEQTKFRIYLKKQSADYDRLTNETEEGEKALYKIKILDEAAKHFAEKLAMESMLFSQKLETNIQDLIDSMLTSKRTVSVSPEFAVKVTDSFNDESKSEGQFAVVSFAYIGGILKMLQSSESLSVKEYPLILDGPLSKLDLDQRQNVVNAIPKFAPQVILFSKDDLHDIFNSENIGRVWTIQSNDEKNIATIEEGYLWK